MAFPFDDQWNLLMSSSIFAENAVLSVEGVDISLRGIFISGTFSEDSPAAYAPKMYVDREFFRFPLVQLDGKLEKPVKEKLVGSSLHLPERNRRFRIYTVIGKENGDMEFELQEVEDQEAVDG